MKTALPETEGKIEELLVVLDKDIQRIEQSLLRLDELRTLVVKRDDAALGKLIESIGGESDSYKSNELKRQSIRKELATVLGCGFEQMTLTRLEAELAGEKRAEVAGRKTLLRALVKQLKKEHLSTAMLLSDCARFNSVLLKGIFDIGRPATITYDADGSAKRQAETAFVNLQF